MKNSFVNIFLFFFFVFVVAVNGQDIPLTKYVNPFIGTSPGNDKSTFNSNTGDVIPGATFPRGMLQWSPDTPSNLPGGYFYPDTAINGFSVRHFSGRGCKAWQDFEFLPVVGDVQEPPSKENKFLCVGFSHENENASPGYYSVRLNNKLKVELAADIHSGMGRFTFTKTSKAIILINAGSSINGTTENTFINLVGSNQIEGYATSKIGCGKEVYTLYFVAEFNRPFDDYSTWNENSIKENIRTEKSSKIGAILTFNAEANRTVEVKIAISFVSIANARENLKAEIPGWDFNKVRTKADIAWNKVLNKIIVKGGALSQRTAFYTALYHLSFHPNIFNDVNGQYIGMDEKIHKVAPGRNQYENIPGWDIYRSATALTSILEPEVADDIAQSLINYAQQGGGGLPRWEQANHNSGGMIGDGPVIILATTHAFGVTNFDTDAALHAMDLNADKVGTTSDGNLVRENLADYIKLGYVPNSASKTLEYANADFALSQFAKAMDDSAKYKLYYNRSGNWKKLYNENTGFIQPRELNGSWIPGVKPFTSKGYTEGSATQYTWMVPFDYRGLFDKMGGDSNAIKRLDKYFEKLNENARSEYAYMGNEPDEGNPWAYVFAGAPSKTQGLIRRIQNELFSDKPNGFPGNDDAGALSSWYIFSALGMYPAIPGMDILVLGSPLFSKATLHLKNGTVVIEGKGAKTDAPYVQSLILNDRQWSKPWIRFTDISNGGKMIYTLRSTPDYKWGGNPINLSPSFQNE